MLLEMILHISLFSSEFWSRQAWGVLVTEGHGLKLDMQRELKKPVWGGGGAGVVGWLGLETSCNE